MKRVALIENTEIKKIRMQQKHTVSITQNIYFINKNESKRNCCYLHFL